MNLPRIRPHYLAHAGETLKLAIPVIIGQLGNIMMSVADNIMVGKIGPEFIAGAGLGASIFFLIYIFGIGLAMGITPLAGEAYGEGNLQKCREYFTNGLFTSIIAGVNITLACLASVWIIPFLGQSKDVEVIAQEFLSLLSIGIIPGIIFLHFKQYIEAFGAVIPGMVVMGIMVVFNIAFNWILIYGNLGFPRLDLNGAGIATSLARFLGMFLLAGWVWKSKRFKELAPLRNLLKPSWQIIRKILAIGIPSGFQYFFEIGAFTGALIMAGWIGKNESAAHNIAINLASISFLVATGIASSSTIRVSQFIGKGLPGQAREAGITAFGMGILFMILSAIVFYFGRNFFPSFYNETVDVLKTASMLMMIAAVFQISDGIQAIGAGALRGLSDARFPAIITLIAYWGIGLPGAYFLGFVVNMGMAGIWYALSVSLTFSAVFLSLRFHRLTKRLILQQTHV